MDSSTIDIVALLRRKADIEAQLLNGHNPPLSAERELEATRRRLAAHPRALNAVLQTAQALRRPPEAVSARDVEDWSGAN